MTTGGDDRNSHHVRIRVTSDASALQLRHYKSISACEVDLGSLVWLIGGNGAGKSNFLDAMHLVSDALGETLESALAERGGIHSVRQRSAGHPKYCTIRLDFRLADGRSGFYAFEIGSAGGRDHFVKREARSRIRQLSPRDSIRRLPRGTVAPSESLRGK